MASVIEENEDYEESETEGSLSVCNKTSMPLAIIVPPPECFYEGCIANHCQRNDEIVDLSSNYATSSRDQSRLIRSFKHNHIISSQVNALLFHFKQLNIIFDILYEYLSQNFYNIILCYINRKIMRSQQLK